MCLVWILGRTPAILPEVDCSFLCSSRQMPRCYLKSENGWFHPHPLLFITLLSVDILPDWATDSMSKKKITLQILSELIFHFLFSVYVIQYLWIGCYSHITVTLYNVQMVLIILLLQFIKCEEVATYMLLPYNMQNGHAAIYLLLLHYIKCRSPVYVTATHIKCRQVVVYMLVLYYINCVVIYTLLHCMNRGILLFICSCYTT